VFAQGLTVVRMGGGGEVTKFICGYMTQATTEPVFLGGTSPIFRYSSQYPRRHVLPMIGKPSLLFGRYCGCRQARWWGRTRQVTSLRFELPPSWSILTVSLSTTREREEWWRVFSFALSGASMGKWPCFLPRR